MKLGYWNVGWEFTDSHGFKYLDHEVVRARDAEHAIRVWRKTHKDVSVRNLKMVHNISSRY